jgi:alkanesulfonate monooxygenase SsuD/methylene tetrahydromethanopterin reductase-like flavin-dependent oxidoreductase (luciferase family)
MLRAAGSGGASLQAFNPFERQHQAKRYADFQQVLLALSGLWRSHLRHAAMWPYGDSARARACRPSPAIGEGLELHNSRDGQWPRQWARPVGMGHRETILGRYTRVGCTKN